MRSLIPFDGLFGDTVLDHFFDDVPTIYKDYVSVPKADIEDLKDHYEVTCDMPGYTKDEIQVTYENGILSLSAKREDTKETKDADRKFIRRERSSAGFQRQFAVSGVQKQQRSRQRLKLYKSCMTTYTYFLSRRSRALLTMHHVSEEPLFLWSYVPFPSIKPKISQCIPDA